MLKFINWNDNFEKCYLTCLTVRLPLAPLDTVIKGYPACFVQVSIIVFNGAGKLQFLKTPNGGWLWVATSVKIE